MKTREEFVNAAVDAAYESHWRMEMAIFALNALLNDYDSNEDYLSAMNVLEYKNSKEEYITINKAIKALGGYYSKFKHGFIFRFEPTEALKGVA